MDTALVIGAGAGVGSHISRQLADARYQVSGLARSERSAAALDRRGHMTVQAGRPPRARTRPGDVFFEPAGETIRGFTASLIGSPRRSSTVSSSSIE
jgi:NAD(P)-dependent dehydrogenase (short-subunit alcohol dehydrogenase family)